MEARHAEELEILEAQHAEERNKLEAKVTQLADIERAIEAFAHEYLQPAPATESAEHVDKEAQSARADLAQHLTAPAEVEVIATNWGEARFTPVEDTHSAKVVRDWGQ
jgi:hypothetical protein